MTDQYDGYLPFYGTCRPVDALKGLCAVLYFRFRQLGHHEDIKNAIRCLWLALYLTSEDTGARSFLLSRLWDLYMNRFEQIHEPTDIDKAIDCQTQAVQLIPDGHANQPVLLNNLGNSYRSRFEYYGRLADVNAAIECHSQGVQLAPDGHADKPGQLSNLGYSHRCRFAALGELADLDKTIEYNNQALLLIHGGHGTKPIVLNNLGSTHRLLFEHYGRLADIDKAIEYHSQAVLCIANGHASKPTLLSGLGNSHALRFKRLGEPVDIDRAIEWSNQAVLLTPEGHIEKPDLLTSLGHSYFIRFEHYGEFADVDRAINYHSRAVRLTFDHHAARPSRLSHLGSSYLSRFEHRGEPADVDKAIECYSQAMELAPNGYADQGMLSLLCRAYQSRFQHYGGLEDINKAIECQSQPLTLVPEDHEHKSDRLSSLGSSYCSRFERLRELTDIDKAIECHGQAVQLTPDGHISKSIRLSRLGSSYFNRFQHLGEPADLSEAIGYYEQAMQLTPDGHAHQTYRLCNLGSSYLVRFERFGRLADLDKGIEYYSQAVRLTSDGHVEKSVRISMLGSSYQSRFERLGQLADINEAVACHSQAVLLTADGHAYKPGLLNNLGGSYLSRFKHHGQHTDIDRAIECSNQAVQLTPDDHAVKPSLLKNLGGLYLNRYAHYEQSLDLEAANTCFERAAQSVVGDSDTRFEAARFWAECASLLGVSPLPAYEKTMELVPQLVWLGISIQQRYSLLTDIGDIARQAASWAISQKSNDRALEWLEEGRSVVWNQILQLRTPFDDLYAVDATLASRLKAVALELEQAGSRPVNASSLTKNLSYTEADAQEHHRLAKEWDELLKQARRIPGFDNFMQPRKAHELMGAAKDGPVAIINIHSSRCDALIIIPGNNNIGHVPLKNFSSKKAHDCRVKLMSLIGHRGGRAGGFKRTTSAQNPDERYKEVLATLWSGVVKPVIDFLGYSAKLSAEELPRVTWCTTGPLSFLPLHAAGCYNGSPNIFEHLVSSYTPTLSALLVPSPVPSLNSGVLAVSQEHTKGFGHLPNTVHELAEIEQHAKGTRYLQLDGHNATADAVLNAMCEYSWVHLACHATQDKQDPSQSAFHLSDGDLALSKITQMSFKNKGLAFLSACQTATGDENLPDEAVHLAAGMQMAGYPSVIATMWSIQDEDGPEVAREVYADLLKDGKMDCTGASRALHKAIARLREKVGESSFERWVPFIHMGL